jgi:hypothetical protein
VKVKKSDWRSISQGFLAVALLCVFAAVLGFLSYDLVLASTQWLLVAAVLGAFAVYFRMEG